MYAVAFLLTTLTCGFVGHGAIAAPAEKRDLAEQGQPASTNGRGASQVGGTNHQIDLDNPANLGAESTDNGVVPNLKWRFSDSHARLSPGGWTRESVVTDLPSSRDIAAAQQHLKKGAIRELHWHRVVRWQHADSRYVPN